MVYFLVSVPKSPSFASLSNQNPCALVKKLSFLSTTKYIYIYINIRTWFRSDYITAFKTQISTTRYLPAADDFAEIRGFFVLAAHVCCFVVPQSHRT